MISDTLFEAFLQCDYKSNLRQSGATGQVTEYELHRKMHAMAYANEAQSRLMKASPDMAHYIDGVTDRQVLMAGKRLLLKVTVTAEDLQASIDALIRVNGPSALGDLAYLPVQYCREEKVPWIAKLMLAYRSIVLSHVQGTLPSHGIIIHGPDFKEEKLKLSSLQDRARRLLQDLRSQQTATGDRQPRLNQHCTICEFQSHCRAVATKADDLSLLGGMNAREIAAQNQKGIFTINQLSYTFRHRKPSKRAKRPSNPHHFALQALSLRTKKVHVHGTPVLPTAETEVYYDIEGLPGEGFYYLIGAAVVQKGEIRNHSFWAESRSEQPKVFLQFVDLVASLPDCKLFHFGRYDIDAVHQAAESNTQLRVHVDRIVNESTNVLKLVHSHIYFPTYSSSLKEIATFLGFRWSEAEVSGIQAIIWRERWELSRDPLLKERLIQYNREDCLALKLVCDFVRTAIDSRPAGPDNSGNPSVVNTKDIAKSQRRWVEYGRPTFLLADLERASNSAHFDYQRERVFARTDKKVARITKRRRRRATLGNPNQHIEIGCEACVHCSGKNIRPTTPVHKRVADLQFSRAGVKRCVRKYSSWRFLCADCKKTFLPDAWPRYRGIYGDQLAIWCVYQNIRGRQTMCQVTEAMSELFALDIRPEQAHKFKRRIGSRYRELYDELRQRIVTSTVLHIDEGDVAIRKTKGYVWVFATLDAVWYLYKDTRSGEFLKELLNGFSGVLVSDFYSAYDAIDCPQQKCLLHLLRDVNEDLKKNPFDDDLKSIAQRFGVVLRSIVETLDQYGMRKRHLHKHKKHAEGFVDYVCTHTFASEVALGYQKRFKKAGSKLFTFLDHDNVPWNNTCAEHAVKNFMKYKRIADGLFSERSLQEALVLLSVVQTCKLNGVNVLRFLLSKRTDINAILGLKPV